MKIDYHVHTKYSPDSNAQLNSVIEYAIKQGIDELCITDHVDNHPVQDRYDVPDYNKFLREYADMKNIYGDKIKLLFGAELSLAPYLTEEVKSVANSYDFDFLIGSSHEVARHYLMTGTEFYNDKSKKEAFTIYFKEVLENVKLFDDFDVYGHLDYIFRYSTSAYKDNSFDYFEYKEIIDEILKILISKNKGIEINCSGFRYGLNCFHPCKDILSAYKVLGGEIVTIGSDAHSPQYVGTKNDEAKELLKSAGFEYMSTFEKRKVKFVRI